MKLELNKSDFKSPNKEVTLNKEIQVEEGSIYLDSISFTPFGAIFFSENRGGWDFKNKDHYYYAMFDETGRQLFIPSTSIGYNYDKKVTKIAKIIKSDEYKNSKTITIKTYDSRSKKEVQGSSVTVTIPQLE